MGKSIGERLSDWTEAGLLDPAQAERILAFERRREPRLGPGLALALGVLLLGAGVLLFVAANWERLSPGARFSTVLALVGGFHLAGARGPRLGMALHGLGTVALGAGIFLAGQIFNLQEHWPGGLMLWALGAWLGYALLRDWVQGLLAALLTPAWLIGEWVEATRLYPLASGQALSLGVLLLAFSYLTARLPGRDSLLRKALAWAGGLALIPATCLLVFTMHGWRHAGTGPEGPLFLAGWAVALGGPLALAALLRGRAAWMNLAAALWALALAWAAGAGPGWAIHGMSALGAVGLILWGLREGRGERVDLGVAAFAITLLAFYFSSIMGKLGRSLGLMILGLLFLAVGWQLERLRRKLNARIASGVA